MNEQSGLLDLLLMPVYMLVGLLLLPFLLVMGIYLQMKEIRKDSTTKSGGKEKL